MEFIADFHIHSKYSRATSRDMDVLHLADWAKLKGITLMGTGDFTHHLWLEELKRNFEDRATAYSSIRMYILSLPQRSAVFIPRKIKPTVSTTWSLALLLKLRIRLMNI